jgi:quercetin dioxygenase-like cupin family protein
MILCHAVNLMNTRVIAATLLTLILISNSACSDANSPETNSNEWKPITTVPGVLRRVLVGDPGKAGPFKYQLKIAAGSRAAVHRHSQDVHVKVLSGSMFIIIGEPLDRSSFVVPANAWHDEWWDEESMLEAEGVGPMETSYRDAQNPPH